MIGFFKTKTAQAILFALLGLLLGWLFFARSSSHSADEHVPTESEEGQVWTCSMHPQIKMDAPGKCPLCAMDLTPLRKGNGSDAALAPNDIQLSEEAIALANIQTSKVSRQNPTKEVQLYGTIQPDERSQQSQPAHVGGRIEQLFVDFTGESVQKGKVLATIYSPELYTAQQELLEAVKMKESQPRLQEAAREKLRLWKLSNEQINKIESSGVVEPLVEIKANTGGIVMTKRVNQGDYVQAGNVLFDIADLSKVWAMFDAFEVDLPFLKVGDQLTFTLQAIPNKKFTGRIAFIDPIINKTTRTARVRVEVSNPGAAIKPEMYAMATVSAQLKQYKNEIVVPQTAVLWTGKRSIVYVRQANHEAPVFQLREIELGPSLGGAYVVLAGLTEGEEIVTNGAFIIDASAQLEGKRSMMNNNEEASTNAEHEGHGPDGGTGSGTSSSSKNTQTVIRVGGSCEMCKDRIEKTAKAVPGVWTAVWNSESKLLHLNFDPSKTSEDAISKAIAKVGHDTDKHEADKAVYDALPECCHYRK